MLLRDAAITGILFDVDGTLIDSVDVHAKAWVEALHDLGARRAVQCGRRQIGKGGDQLLPVSLSQKEIDRNGTELDAYRGRLFKVHYLPHVRAFPGVRARFERLIEDGKRIPLASSAKEDELAQYRRIAGIDDLIHAETSADAAERSKPYPGIFQAALAKLGSARSRVWWSRSATPTTRRPRARRNCARSVCFRAVGPKESCAASDARRFSTIRLCSWRATGVGREPGHLTRTKGRILQQLFVPPWEIDVRQTAENGPLYGRQYASEDGLNL